MLMLQYFKKVIDPRRAQGKKYPLHYLLLFCVFAVLSGAKSYRDLSRFMKKKRLSLNKVFDLDWKSSPSKSQIRDILCTIEVDSIESVFRDYSQMLNKQSAVNNNQVSLDGKSLRGSADPVNNTSMLQILSAFCSKTKLILGHVDIAEKTNEIPTAQQLISAIGLPENTLYTADALHCQKKHLNQ